MKKKVITIILVFLYLISLPICANKQTQSTVENAIATSVGGVYDDTKRAVSTVYEDGKNAITSSVSTVYDDTKSAVSTVYEDGKNAIKTIYPDVRAVLENIGKSLGVAAEHVYGVLVKKYIVMGIKQLIFFLGGIITFILSLMYLYKSTPKNQPITYRVIVPLITFVIGIVVLSKVNYDEMLIGLINPEFGAINYILEVTKELIKN